MTRRQPIKPYAGTLTVTVGGRVVDPNSHEAQVAKVKALLSPAPRVTALPDKTG